MSINKAILIGNLGADPDIHQFNNGDKIATVSVATSERWTDKRTGEKKETTEWHRVVFGGRLAEIAEQYLTKGSKVYVEGSIKTKQWTDKQGVDRTSTEIRAVSMQMLGGGQGEPQQGRQRGYQQGQRHQPQPSYEPRGQSYDPSQDPEEMPF